MTITISGSVEVGNDTRPESSNPVICSFSRKNVSSLNVIIASRAFFQGRPFFTRRHCAADNLRRRNDRGVETRATRSTPFRGRPLADKRAARTYQTLAKAIIGPITEPPGGGESSVDCPARSLYTLLQRLLGC